MGVQACNPNLCWDNDTLCLLSLLNLIKTVKLPKLQAQLRQDKKTKPLQSPYALTLELFTRCKEALNTYIVTITNRVRDH